MSIYVSNVVINNGSIIYAAMYQIMANNINENGWHGMASNNVAF